MRPLILEAHHVRFRSLGGGDEPENLVALCPTCHRGLAHRLYAPEEFEVLREAALQWERLVRVQLGQSSAGSWNEAAEMVLDPQTREAALLLGAYELVMAWVDSLLGRGGHGSVVGATNRFRLIMLASEMSTYVDPAGLTDDRLEEARGLRRRAALERSDTNSLALVEARCCHLRRDVHGEELALERYVASSQGDPEFSFRTMSFALQADRPIPSPSQRARLGIAESVGHRMALANIIGDRGRWLYREDRNEEAYRELSKSFLMGRLSFHRRGMFVKAMLLADIALRLGEGRMAAEWWSIGSQFTGVGRNLPLEPENLRLRIAKMAGESAFLGIGSLGRSLQNLVPDDALAVGGDRTALGKDLFVGIRPPGDPPGLTNAHRCDFHNKS